MIQKYKYILGIALVAVVSFFSTVSTTYANDITFSAAGGGNRYNGIDSITSGSAAPQRYNPVPGGIFECADWEDGRSICRKEYRDNNQSGRNVLVYGDCDNTGSSPRYDCTEITNIPDEYTSTNASRNVPREVIASSLGETAEESSETLNFEDGYTVTVDNSEYQGECAEFTRDGEPGIACKAEGITGTLDDCFRQSGGADREVTCRSTRVLGDPQTVGDLANSEPIASESQATGVQEANDRAATGGSSTTANPVSYQSFTSFPGVGRISNICQLTQALWYLGFAILFTAAFGMFIYAGFLYTSSGVNAAQVNQAKGIFTNTIIGVILGLSVFIILNIINPGLLTANCEVAAVTGSGSTQTNPGSDGSTIAPGESSFPIGCDYAIPSGGQVYGAPRDGGNRIHAGTDFAPTTGVSCPILSYRDGVVTGFACNGPVVDHGGGLVTRYLHNSSNVVSVGDQVQAGQTLGFAGNVACGSQGVHLHFEIIQNGTPQNPETILLDGSGQPKADLANRQRGL